MIPLVLFLLLLLALQQLRVVLQLVLVSLQRLLRVLQLVPRLRTMLRCLLLLVLMLLYLLLLVLMLLSLLLLVLIGTRSGSLPLLCHGAYLLLQQPLRFAVVTIAVCADVVCEPLWFVLVLFPRLRWSQHLRGRMTLSRSNIPTHLC